MTAGPTDGILATSENNPPDGAVFRLVRRPDGAYRFAHLSAGTLPLAGVRPADVLHDTEAFIRRVVAEDRLRLWVALERSAADRKGIHTDIRV